MDLEGREGQNQLQNQLRVLTKWNGILPLWAAICVKKMSNSASTYSLYREINRISN